MRVNLESLPGMLIPSAAAKVFHLSARRIQQLAAAGRIAGARKRFGRWDIPLNALNHVLNTTPSKGGRGKRVKPTPDLAALRSCE